MSEKELQFIPLQVPPGAIENPDNIDCRGMQFWKNKKNGFTVAVVHFTSDPDKRSPAWFKSVTQNMRQDQCDREFHIDFTSKAGQKAFWYLAENPQRWQEDDYDLKTIPKSWRIVASLDYGTKNPTAILIHGVDQQNRFHVLWEFYKPSSVKEIAEVLKGNHPDYPHPLWKRIEKVMADPSIWKGDQNIEGKEEMDSVADLLEQKGIYNLERGTNNRLAGLDRVQEMLNFKPNDPSPKTYLFIAKRCKNLWSEMLGLVYDEIPQHLLGKKNQKEDVTAKDDHGYDALRYGIMSITEPPGDDPEPPPGEFTLAQMEKDMDNFEDDDGIDFF
jgi:hypothetical protein